MTITAVLDANVLYPIKLRGMLLWVAHLGGFAPVWSDIILDEWTRNLKKNNPDIDIKKLEKSCHQMNQGFPFSNISGKEITTFLSKVPELPDPDDKHVVAAALASEANYIVTYNLKDFPHRLLNPLGIQALKPDNFFCLLSEQQPQVVYEGIEAARKRWKNPPFTIDELIFWMQNNKLTKLSTFLETFKTSE